ncbi:hypothetical protein CYLTODRAFT_493436 [Cylindrobasidium torrendii FP15055 ss-10]|uniref:F-box domain-containing protein n=1 Tax=Cylindrobasidium torrendii FP15055 ss-10 TaxID=1314674 RepID=A0A0D7B1J8_9AGAR|nr:hypothetical protein CYLTODRAFT_493436 [Cylindrobasidium torrendii FP15055 ss-10]
MNAIRNGSDVTLPAEVIFMILEAVAVALYPHSASRLLLISRAACQWLEPFVYHTIVLRSLAQSNRFKTTVRQRRLRDPEFFHRNVRVVICKLPRGGVHDGTLKHLLKACNHVVHVSCAATTIAQALPTGALRSLRYLNAHGDHVPSSPTVTHLVLRQFSEQFQAQSMMERIKRCLPNLTHLCLDVELLHGYREAVAGVLNAVLADPPPKMQRIIVVFQFVLAWLWGMAAQHKILDAAIRKTVGEGRTMPVCFAVLPPSVDEEVSTYQVIPSRDVAAVLGWDTPSLVDNIWTRAEVLSPCTE